MGYRTKHREAAHYCFNCLHGFAKKETLDNHIELCYKQRTQAIKFPKKPEEKEVFFKNIKKQLPAPFIIYADFEAFTTKIDEPQHGNTTMYQRHIPSGFGYMVVSTAPQYTKEPVIYRGENVIDTFLERLIEEHQQINTILSYEQPMVMTAEDVRQHERATECFICNQLLGAERPVQDHDHLTGKYRGAAHSECNLAFKHQRFNNSKKNPSYIVPVVFHNLRGYDGHHLMSGIGKFKNRRISCIANNSERYITFGLSGLQFIDSLQFTNSSLERLVDNLTREEFQFLHKYIDGQQKQDLMLRKGVFPYDYVDKPTKLEEKRLPPKQEFYSKLYDEDISDSDYQHA